MKKVDLNVDIGEGFPHDEELLEFATSANVCCGEHAGSWALTRQTIEMCKSKGVRIGAHPGFPDRESLGRRTPRENEIDAFLLSVGDQVERFVNETKTSYVKPHGAFYNILGSRGFPNEFGAAVYGACGGSLIHILMLTGLPPMLLLGSRDAEVVDARIAPVWGTKTIFEGFADRKYRPDGTLVPRNEPGAVLEDPAEIRDQVLRIAPTVDSICLHGDNENCLTFAELVKKTLIDSGYEVGY